MKIYAILFEFLKAKGLQDAVAKPAADAAMLFGIVLAGLLVHLLAKKVLMRLLKTITSKSKTNWDDVLYRHGVFERLVIILPALVVYALAPMVSWAQVWIQRITFCIILLGILRALDKLLDAVDDIYRRYEISKLRPIKGYLQVVKMLAYIVGGIIIVSTLVDRSPLILLGGIGAATAVLLLIFQNTILGFVASIQLTENDMVRLGDWIEMESHGANGTVSDITIHTVKVKNWDNTITTIPTYSLVSESFKNWRSMKETGARRLVRALYIDMTSIRFCDEEMLERFRKIQYIQDYLERKLREVEEYNAAHQVDPSSVVNGRRLTNIGTFRAYVQAYLDHHPGIHQGMSKMVRQKAPTEHGLPLEIYVFTNTTEWEKFEAIQSDIFDHLLAVLPQFDLRIYQSPTGHDLGRVAGYLDQGNRSGA